MEQVKEKHISSVGSVIGLAFGGVWSVLAAHALPPRWRIPALVLGLALTATLIFRRWRRPAAVRGVPFPFRSRYYIATVVLELIALNVAANLLLRHGLAGYLLSAVGIIVGLHFIGLWMAARMTRFLWIASTMSAVSALLALLPATSGAFRPRDAAIGCANALILWIGASC